MRARSDSLSPVLSVRVWTRVWSWLSVSETNLPSMLANTGPGELSGGVNLSGVEGRV